MILNEHPTYQAICEDFRWDLPDRYNCVQDLCDRHAGIRPNPALIIETDADVRRYSFTDLRDASMRLANALSALGLTRGDRVAIVAQPCFEIPVTHIACWRSGLISCAMATLFATDALVYRFQTSGARAVVTDRANLDKVRDAAQKAGNPEHILVIGAPADQPVGDATGLDDLMAAHPAEFETVDTAPGDPAFLNFTSGTTGQPKGVLAPHSAIPGQAAAMEFLYDFPAPGDVLWSPADWAWLAGQTCVMTTGLFLGMSVVARPRAGFDPLDAFRLMSEHRVTHALLVPTMMKMMRQVPAADRGGWPLYLKTNTAGGEPCGPELYRWSEEVLGARLNEAYGQTECSTMLIHNLHRMNGPIGSLGKAAPGLQAAIVDAAGNELPHGELGQIAVRTPHPIVFLEYWKNPEATAEKFANGWMLTGDMGYRDAEGFFWFKGRADDVITSSGYRIGPGEVEDAILQHPAVALVAVVGLPDPVRTEVVTAFVVVAEGHTATPDLAEAIRDFVRDHLARHEVPREIRFVDHLPTTTTGKIMRKAVRDAATAAGQPAA